jgi:hypothetical protein
MRAAFDEIYKNQDVSPEAKKVLDTGMYSVRNAPKADKTVITPNVVTEREPSKTATAMLAALTGSATAQAANVPGSITNNTERTSEVARNVPTNTNTSTSQVTNNVTKPVVSAVTNTSPVTFKPLEPKDVAAIAAPLEAMRDDNAKNTDQYYKTQLSETKRANEEEKSFWELGLVILIGILCVVVPHGFKRCGNSSHVFWLKRFERNWRGVSDRTYHWLGDVIRHLTCAGVRVGRYVARNL